MAPRSTDKRAARRAAVFIAAAATVIAGVWALPRVSSAAAGWAKAPPVRERTVRLTGGLAVATRAAGEDAGPSQEQALPELKTSPEERAVAPQTPGTVVEPGFRFDMVGLLCDVPPAPGARLTVHLRWSEDGGRWSPWTAVDLEVRGGARGGTDGAGDVADGPDRAAGGPGAFTEPVWVGSARYVEVRAEASGRRSDPALLRGVRLMFLNTSGDATVSDQLVSALRSTVATIAGIGAAPAAMAMTEKPAIVTRAEWGADESLRRHAPEYAPVKMAFVHHTVNANSYTRAQAPGLVRGIYYYDVKGLEWSDLGYNFLIDRYGTIYEGRYGGMTKGVIGAQVLGFNTGSTGIAMIGNFVSATPPAAMMSALKKLLAWKLDVHHIEPQATARLECRYTRKYTEGEIVAFPVIAGHRAANWTACPGDGLYRLLPGVRTAVGGMGLPKIYDYRVDLLDLSPNGDGVQESTRVRFRISETAGWTVAILDGDGTERRRFSGSGQTVDLRWDGRDDSGTVVGDGPYRVVAHAEVAGAQARAATATVDVDTVPPAPAVVAVTPAVFSPNGDGYGDRARLRFTLSEPSAARVRVVDGEGVVLGVVSAWRTGPAGERSVFWDGRIAPAAATMDAPEGKVLLAIEAKDAAGNRATRTASAYIDRTLGYLRTRPETVSPNGDGVQDQTSVGFRLTRRATVALSVESGEEVVRDLGRATYAAGALTVIWDGLLTDGSRAPSGVYRVRAAATSELGDVGATRWVKVDRYRPRLEAPAGLTVAYGKRAKVVFVARDPYSVEVRVTATVRSRTGRRLAVIDRGWVSAGVPASVFWKPPARRTYTVRLTAVDRGGNSQYAATVTKVIVR